MELDYFQQEFGVSFERTYGWAWLLKLQEELEASAEVFDQNISASYFGDELIIPSDISSNHMDSTCDPIPSWRERSGRPSFDLCHHT